MRQILRRLHLWLGLSLGLLFVMLGLTGSVLVFYTSIDAMLNPSIISQKAGAPDWDRAVATVRVAYPDKTGPWRFEVTGEGGPIPARYNKPPETAHRDFAPMMVWLSSDGSHIVRRDYWGDYAMTFIYDLHFRLLLGEAGGVFIGWAGIALLILLLSGLWAWWPRGGWRKALRYKGHAPRVRRLRDQHKIAGLIGLPFLLMLTVTGVMLNLPKESDTVLTATLGPIDPSPSPSVSDGASPKISVSKALAIAQSALTDGKPAWIEVPGIDGGPYRFRMAVPGDPSLRFPHSFVWVDSRSGQITGLVDARKAGASTTVNNWVHALHNGAAGGLLLRVLLVFAGFAPLILFITGIRRWRHRLPPARRSRAGSGGPNSISQ